MYEGNGQLMTDQAVSHVRLFYPGWCGSQIENRSTVFPPQKPGKKAQLSGHEKRSSSGTKATVTDASCCLRETPL